MTTAISLSTMARRSPIWPRVGVLCLALAALADAVLRHEKRITGDEPFYLRMAAHPGRPHSFPYAYRVAVPWLVHLLPFSPDTSFSVLALLGIAATGAALYALLAHFEVSVWLAVALAAGCSVSPILLVVLLRHGRSIDPESTLVMVLGTLFIVRRQKLAVAITLLIGVAVKETSLFLVPLAYAVWARRPLDRQAIREVVVVSAASVAAYVVLRTSVSAIGNQYTPGYAGSFLAARAHVLGQVFTGTQLRRLAYAFGPLWLVAPFALRDVSFARRGLVLVMCCIGALSVSFDAGRVIFIAAPVFYVAAALVVEPRRRLALGLVLVLLAVDGGYALYMQIYGVEHGLDATSRSAIPVY